MNATTRGILTLITAIILAAILVFVKLELNTVGAILTVLTATAIALLVHAALMDLP